MVVMGKELPNFTKLVNSIPYISDIIYFFNPEYSDLCGIKIVISNNTLKSEIFYENAHIPKVYYDTKTQGKIKDYSYRAKVNHHVNLQGKYDYYFQMFFKKRKEEKNNMIKEVKYNIQKVFYVFLQKIEKENFVEGYYYNNLLYNNVEIGSGYKIKKLKKYKKFKVDYVYHFQINEFIPNTKYKIVEREKKIEGKIYIDDYFKVLDEIKKDVYNKCNSWELKMTYLNYRIIEFLT